MNIVEVARSFKGAKWRHASRKPWAMDCIGLLELSAKGAGIPFPAYEKVYGREPWDDRLRKELTAWCGPPVERTEAKAGDVALIRWGSGEPSHVGIIGDSPDGLTLIHAHNRKGVIEQSIRGPVFQVVIEVYRIGR